MGMERREGSDDKVTKGGEMGGNGTGEGALTFSSGGRALFGYLCTGPRFSSYATVDGACLAYLARASLKSQSAPLLVGIVRDRRDRS